MRRGAKAGNTAAVWWTDAVQEMAGVGGRAGLRAPHESAVRNRTRRELREEGIVERPELCELGKTSGVVGMPTTFREHPIALGPSKFGRNLAAFRGHAPARSSLSWSRGGECHSRPITADKVLKIHRECAVSL